LGVLRVQGAAHFQLHWSVDEWKTAIDTQSSHNSLQIDYVDLPDAAIKAGDRIRFTFLWTESGHWEGKDYLVSVTAANKQ
jgi:glucoamylase